MFLGAVSVGVTATWHNIAGRCATVWYEKSGCSCTCSLLACVPSFEYSVDLGGRDSSVGVATCYGLDGPGIESWRGRLFSHLSRPAPGLTNPPLKCVARLLFGGKAAGACS